MSPYSESELDSGSLTVSGAFFLAALFNCGLFGILSVQVYIYYLAFPKDPKLTRILVNGLYLLETFEMVVIIYNTYTMFGLRFGDKAVLSERLLLWILPITVSIATFAVHCYYAYCIRTISQSRVIASVIVVITCIQLVGGISTGVFTFLGKSVTNIHLERVDEAFHVGFWHGGSALCDIIIAVSMIYYLSRSDSLMKRTQLLLRRVVRLTVETGSLTALVTITCIALMLTKNHLNFNRVYIGIIGKLYANSVVVLINSRLKLGNEAEETRVSLGFVPPSPPYWKRERSQSNDSETRLVQTTDTRHLLSFAEP